MGLSAFVQRSPWILGAVVVLLACCLRLALVETSRFTGDEAEFYSVARDIADTGVFPLLGPPITSGQARHPGPLFFWLMALPMCFTRAPEACNALVALLGGASVGFFWHGLRRSFGDVGAFIAALLMACMPWSALYADRIWNSNVVGFPTALAFWGALRVRRCTPDDDGSASRGLLVMLPAAAVIPQFHMSAPIVWVALLPLAWPGLRHARPRHIFIGLTLAALLYVPYLIHELRTDFGNTRAFFREQEVGTAHGFALVPLYLFRFLTVDVSYHLMTGYWQPVDEGKALASLFVGTDQFPLATWRFLLLAASIATAGAAVVVGARLTWVNRRPGPFATALLLGAVVDMLLLGLSGKGMFAHYAQPLIFFLFPVFAMLGRVAARSTQHLIPTAVLVAITCIAGVDATWRVSSRLDARNGLATQRALIHRLDYDAGEEHVSRDAPVWLELGYYGFTRPIEVLARRALDVPLRIQRGAKTRHYRLQRVEDAAPPTRATDVMPMHEGPVVLYRLR